MIRIKLFISGIMLTTNGISQEHCTLEGRATGSHQVLQAVGIISSMIMSIEILTRIIKRKTRGCSGTMPTTAGKITLLTQLDNE